MQTYATLETLRSLGHDVTLINLIHPKLRNHKMSLNLSGILNEVCTLQFGIFQLFHFGKQTKRMYSINPKYIPKADYTIVGSDQVWNSDITTKIRLSYFLDFAKTTRRLSYASSFGKYKWEEGEDYSCAVRKELVNFNAISVREESGVEICKDVFHIDAIQLLDPTLMHSDYNELVGKTKHINVIFPFVFSPGEEEKRICSYVSERLSIPIYTPNKFSFYFGRSPKSWLRRMKNSAFIITNSFHGLAFSIIFHKQFLVLCADKKKFARISSLLRLFNLEERFVDSFEDLLKRDYIIRKSIDYNSVEMVLEKERDRTRTYLMNNII